MITDFGLNLGITINEKQFILKIKVKLLIK